MLLLSLPLSVLAQATDHLSEVTVNVETPGTLGDLILQQTADLTDVVTLHLGGTINDDDVQTLQKQLKRLRHLDALNLQMPEVPQRFLYNCDTLRTVILPAVATIINKNAFDSCDSLKSVTLPEGLTTIGDYAFRSCSKLQDIPFPSTLKSIGESAFVDNRSLTKVLLPEGLETLGENAFSSCTSLSEVNIPSTLKVIPQAAFRNAYELESLTIPEGVTEIGGSAFYHAFWYDKNRSGEKRIHLAMPSTLKSIGRSAFSSNPNIVELTFKEGLESLAYECFYGASIKEVTLPSTVKMVYTPFHYCDSLKRVTCLSLVPPANYDYNFLTANNTEELKGVTMVVPAASIKEYKQTTGYDHYGSYESIDYLPTNITINRDFRLTVPANAPQLNITMEFDTNAGNQNFDGMGTLRIEGDNPLNVGSLSLFYDFDRSSDYKYGNAESTYDPWGTNPDNDYDRLGKRGFTSIIADVPWTVQHVNQDIKVPRDPNDKNTWMFFSPLCDVKMSDIQSMNELGAQFVIYDYDSQQRAGNTGNTWRRITADKTLLAGHGYIIMAVGYGNYTNYWGETSIQDQSAYLRFPSKDDGSQGTLCTTDDITIQLKDYPTPAPQHRGWNFIANPYPCYVNGAYVDFTAPIIIWNPNKNRYYAIRLMDDVYVFSPMEAFFVQYNDQDNKVVFHKEGRQLGLSIEQDFLPAPRHAATSLNRKVFNIMLSNGNDHDHTRFVINPEAKADYEADKDAAYMPSLSDDVSALYTRQNSVHYAINERPVGDGLIDLGMRLATDGTYTLSLNTKEIDEVLLIDRQANTTIPLTAEGYTFTAEAGTIEGRFAIQLSGMTGIKNENVNKNDNAIYDLQGRRIECSMFNVQCSMLKKGIYIIGGKKHVVK